MSAPAFRPRYGAVVAASLTAEAVFIVMVALISALRDMDPWKYGVVFGWMYRQLVR